MNHTLCDHSVWLFPLSVMVSRFLHVTVSISISFFLWLNIIPLYGYTTFCCPSVDGHLGCLHFLDIMNNATMNFVYMFLCGHMFQIYICKYFLSFCGLSFQFLDRVLLWSKVFSFGEAQFIYFSFCPYALGVISNELSPNPRS